MVDLGGEIVAQGTLCFPTDDAGHFKRVATGWLRIGRGRKAVACHVSRHGSGFLDVQEVGAALYLPGSFGLAIERALRFGAKSLVHMISPSQDGALADSTSRIERRQQPLTNAELFIDEDCGTVRVRISAILKAQYFESWNTSVARYWSDEEAKVELTYSVDPLTRVFALGSYVPEVFGERSSRENGKEAMPPKTRLPDLRLESALVAPLCSFGRSGADWISFYDSDGPGFAGVSITKHGPPSKHPAGFFEDSADYYWPRISLKGLKMDMIASLLRGSTYATIVMNSENIGDLGYGRGDEDIPYADRRITGAELDLTLTRSGLEWDYQVSAARESRRGEFVLPWETLILRYPVFAPFRKTVLDRP